MSSGAAADTSGAADSSLPPATRVPSAELADNASRSASDAVADDAAAELVSDDGSTDAAVGAHETPETGASASVVCFLGTSVTLASTSSMASCGRFRLSRGGALCMATEAPSEAVVAIGVATLPRGRSPVSFHAAPTAQRPRLITRT